MKARDQKWIIICIVSFVSLVVFLSSSQENTLLVSTVPFGFPQPPQNEKQQNAKQKWMEMDFPNKRRRFGSKWLFWIIY